MDVDNQLFNFAYGIVCGEKIEKWVWFLETIVGCLGGLKLVFISDRNPAIVVVVV